MYYNLTDTLQDSYINWSRDKVPTQGKETLQKSSQTIFY